MKRRMKMRVLAQVMCLVFVIGALFHGTMGTVEAQTTQTIKIMPLGDSITDCDFWRTKLFNRLDENGFDVQSVGTQYGGHEGHSGMLVTDLAKSGQLTSWLSASNPDIVMLLFGTNDCWCDKGAKAILSAYTTLVGEMRENNPQMIIVVGKVTPLIPNFTSDFVYRAEELAEAIDGWAEDLSTTESPIYVTDQFTGFDAMTDTYDGVHPNDSGSVKMCNKWYDTLSQVLSGDMPEHSSEPEISTVPEESKEPEVSTVPEESKEPEVSTEPEASIIPTIAPSIAPETSETPAKQDDFALDTNVSAWSTGFTAAINVNNNSDKAVSDWKLVISKADFEISSAWCVEVEETDDAYILTPMSWNKTISAGSFASFGFQGTGTMTNFDYVLTAE